MNSTQSEIPEDECPFCFSDRKPQDMYCNICMFPLRGSPVQMNEFESRHTDLKKSIGRSAWWISVANQALLGALLSCVVAVAFMRWRSSLPFNTIHSPGYPLLMFGLMGALNLVLYFFINRFNAVTAAVAGCAGVLLLIGAFFFGRLTTTLIVLDVVYIGIMAVTFFQLSQTAEKLRQHLVRGGL
ncbi:MAG: hypothetical protein ACRC3B_22545 [Bacteroidia bacterium]